MGAATKAEKDMPTLVKELEAAQEQYDQAKTEEGSASRRATDTLNHLNRAQSQIEAWLVEQRKDAPRDTDWGRRRGIEETP